jgi:hypothetical protein
MSKNYKFHNPEGLFESGFVSEPWYWKYSSAKDYCNDKGLVNVCLVQNIYIPQAGRLR